MAVHRECFDSPARSRYYDVSENIHMNQNLLRPQHNVPWRTVALGMRANARMLLEETHITSRKTSEPQG